MTTSEALISRRIEACQRSLAELDIIAQDDELVARNAQEFIVLKKFRDIKKREMERVVDEIVCQPLNGKKN